MVNISNNYLAGIVNCNENLFPSLYRPLLSTFAKQHPSNTAEHLIDS